jgi:hypothetical protein
MKRPIVWFFACSTFLALGSIAPGCGEDAKTQTTGTAGSGGTATGTSGSGGTGGDGTGGGTGGGGTGGSSGTGGTAGQAGSTPDSGADSGGTTVTCGTRTCADIEVMGMMLLACCPQGETNACGGSFGGAFCLTTTPGTPNPACPDVMLMGLTLPGCCGVTGFCGAELSTLGPLGCNDFSAATGGTPTPCRGDAAP